MTRIANGFARIAVVPVALATAAAAVLIAAGEIGRAHV